VVNAVHNGSVSLGWNTSDGATGRPAGVVADEHLTVDLLNDDRAVAQQACHGDEVVHVDLEHPQEFDVLGRRGSSCRSRLAAVRIFWAEWTTKSRKVP
jgi:hypothetical protein